MDIESDSSISASVSLHSDDEESDSSVESGPDEPGVPEDPRGGPRQCRLSTNQCVGRKIHEEPERVLQEVASLPRLIQPNNDNNNNSTDDNNNTSANHDDENNAGANAEGEQEPVSMRLRLRKARRLANERCWLCTFCLNKHAKRVSAFITDNISMLDTLHIARQIKSEVLSLYPHAVGIRKRDIIRHIRQHMICPSVKMATLIRSLVSLAETLRDTLHQNDPETGQVMVDVKNTEVYLKVVNQLTNSYKLDSSKLMFANPHGATVSVTPANNTRM
jgi:hypothetical protein